MGYLRLFECIGAGGVGVAMKKGSPRDYDAETGGFEALAFQAFAIFASGWFTGSFFG